MAVSPEPLGASACTHRCPLSNLLSLTGQTSLGPLSCEEQSTAVSPWEVLGSVSWNLQVGL